MDTHENAWIRRIRPEISHPSLKDNTGDIDRLRNAIKKALHTEVVVIDHALMNRISVALRTYGCELATVLYQENTAWHLIDVGEPFQYEKIYGISVDLGTSTIVIRLLDLISQDRIHEKSFPNPQTEIGLDILSRIHYASQEGGLATLQNLVIHALNREILHLCHSHGIHQTSIMGVTMAGNTTMTHLLLGLNPYWICREPYLPVVNRPDIVQSTELELAVHPHAPVLVLPNVGSYCGGDLVAGIIAAGMHRREEVSLLVDVGTNAEVVVGNKEWLLACAGAAGPALEGGVARIGMMAGPGAIEKVDIDSRTGGFLFSTIENVPPAGICGSGMIDLVACLFLTGMIDQRGIFVPERCGKRLREIDGVNQFIVIDNKESATGDDLTLSQADIASLMRSKAAMFTILTTVMGMIHIPFELLTRFSIAGTFGSYINPHSAITIGMLPDLPRHVFHVEGNTSLEGATMALLSMEARDMLYEIQDRITYVELNVNQEFMNTFRAAQFLPHTDRSLFPSVSIAQGG